MSIVDAYFLFMGGLLALLLGAWARTVLLLISPRAHCPLKFMSRIRNRLLERLGIQAEPPDGVERAPRRERVKRTAWLVASTCASLLIGTYVVGGGYTLIGRPMLPGAANMVLPLLVVGIAVVIDSWLFSWGLDFFELEPPWQFRVDGDRDG